MSVQQFHNGNIAVESREPTEFEQAQMAHWAVEEELHERMAQALEAIAELATSAKRSRWLR